jgi:hypothetical protein
VHCLTSESQLAIWVTGIKSAVMTDGVHEMRKCLDRPLTTHSVLLAGRSWYEFFMAPEWSGQGQPGFKRLGFKVVLKSYSKVESRNLYFHKKHFSLGQKLYMFILANTNNNSS